jgi:ParB-like chromosome segregation protein Spo0J
MSKSKTSSPAVDRGLEVERVEVSTLLNDPANVRKHNERNLESIKASLARFGQQKPIVVGRDGVVIAGNGTLAAARSLGWSMIDIVRSHLTGAEATAYAIADNRTAELAEWDEESLAQQLAALQIEDEELLAATGFDEKELESMSGPAEVEEDEVPEPPVDPITKPGDLWILGEHRLLCGDSTKADNVERLMDGSKTDLLLTDPPYGIDYGRAGGFSASHGWGKWRENVEWDKERPSRKTMESALSMAREAIVWGGNYFTDYLPPSMGWLVWDKGQRDFSLADCELAWRSERKAARVLTLSRAKALQDGKQHPTQKPVALMSWCIEQANEAKTIYDPFLGSGTTLIAAEQLGRKCYGMEISPAYCDVIVKRWETLTGKKAERGA